MSLFNSSAPSDTQQMNVEREGRLLRRRLLLLGASTVCLLLMLGSSGCSSTKSSGSGSHAGVTITNHPEADVILMSRDVFVDKGFAMARTEADRMIFERPATTKEIVKYGGWSSAGVIIRAKLDIQQMGPDTYYLRCDVFAIRDAGDSVLEDETRLVMFSSRPYKDMLAEIKAKLDGTYVPPDP